ncbi:MAG: PBS lyase [Deltaproteobacteria bacterium]|nr:PBS lyase [Deltaproteobacteria bacterium]
MVSRFSERTIIEKPICPFCGSLIDRPKDLDTRMPNEMPVGRCACGAVYACDITGHNLGSALIEALVFACKGDWDLAWGLFPEEDYLEKEVFNYDLETHLIIHSGAYEGRQINGVLYFIRMHEDIREVTDEGTKRLLERGSPPSTSRSRQRKGKKAFSKKDVERLVKDYKVEEILEMAEQDQRIIRDLKRLLYAVDDLARLQAADILGKVSGLVSRQDPESVSRLLQSLFTAVTDTAASSWGYIDAVGEIISNRPDQFGGYVPQLYPLAADRALLPDVLRAFIRVSASRPDILRKKAYQFIPLLGDPDPTIRGYTAMLLGALEISEAKNDIAGLVDDEAPVQVYEAGQLAFRSVGDLASHALSRL